MFDTIAPRYDLVNRVMTFRLDTRWRRRAVRDLGLPAGSLVLDLAAGPGDLCRDLRKSAAYLPPPDRLVAMVAAAGFPDTERVLLSGGISQLLAGTRA